MKRADRLTARSLDRKVTVLVVFLTTLVVGAAALTGIPQELIPDGFEAPQLTVRVPYPEAPAKEVEDKITVPLEDELGTIRGLNRTITISSSEGVLAFLVFKYGTDMDVAFREVRDRLERARARFPDDVRETYISKDDASGLPVYLLGVAFDPGISDPYALLESRVVRRLERIDGVARIEIEGLEEREVLIEFDRERLAAAGLDPYRIGQSLAADNFTLASGEVREGGRELALRGIAEYDSLEALRDRPVSSTARLRDVADVTYREPDKTYRVRAFSKPAVALGVYAEGDANVRDLCARLDAETAAIGGDPALLGTDLKLILSQGELIEDSLSIMLESGVVGGLIAAVVLFLFLRRLRMTLILSLSIPLSLLIGVTVMYFGGETLNILTLLGLMMSVGLLVDNSVVVAENIHRLHATGMPRRDACVRGAGEVALAITMSTLTTIVVFLPMSLVDGPIRFFLLRLSIPVCVSLAASLVIALAFIPLCMYVTLPSRSDRVGTRTPSASARIAERGRGVLRVAYDAVFERMNRGYARLLAFYLGRRLELVLSLAGVAIVTVGVAKATGGVELVPVQEEEQPGFEIGVQLPPGGTIEEAEAWFLEAEAIVESMATDLGLDGWLVQHDAEDGSVQGWLAEKGDRVLSAREVTRRVRDALPVRPGMELFTGLDDVTEDVSAEQAVFGVMLYGNDMDRLAEVADELGRTLARVDGVVGRRGSGDTAPNQIGLVVDRDRAQKAGADPRTIAGVVGYALRGRFLADFRKDGREVPVRVRFAKEDRRGLEELGSFEVPTADGDAISIDALTRAEFIAARQRVLREDRQILRRVVVELDEDRAEETRERLAAIVAGYDFPEGVRSGADFTSISIGDDAANFRFAALLSVVFVFLLMAFLFESFILPLSIVLTIPLSALGVFWSHLVFGKDIDILGAVGVVLLIGVVVNNGIVFVDYVQRLRGSGLDRADALLEAARRRFRPIMMTAITTIGGMLPLAFAGAVSRIGIGYTSFAMTLIGGMTSATFLTLLVVPVFYTMFEDLRLAIGGAIGRGLRRGSGRRGGAPVEA